MDQHQEFRDNVRQIFRAFVMFFTFAGAICGVLFLWMVSPSWSGDATKDERLYAGIEIDEDKIEDGIHIKTGLKEGEGLMEVVDNCTHCHSAQLIIQNRMNEEAWAATIDWMQETQNLGNLGANEEIIINYLVTHYPVVEKGRRQNLINIDWYKLED